MRILVLLLTCILLLACPGTSSNSDKESRRELTILAYNIRHGKGMDNKIDLQRVADVIDKVTPDLVALQEVDKVCERSGRKDIARELGKLLGMRHRFGKFMDYQGGEYGMAILSRFPIAKTFRHPLPDGAEPRCALEVQVAVPDLPAPLSFVGIHNDWTDEDIRVQQVAALLRALNKRTNPIILAGDFNGERLDKSMQLLKKHAWNILAKEQMTFPADKPRVEIDFIVLKNFQKISFEHQVIDEQIASDHRPVIARIAFSD